MINKNKILKSLKTTGYILVSLVFILGVLGIGVYIGYSHRPEIEKVASIINKTKSALLMTERTSVPLPVPAAAPDRRGPGPRRRHHSLRPQEMIGILFF